VSILGAKCCSCVNDLVTNRARCGISLSQRDRAIEFDTYAPVRDFGGSFWEQSGHATFAAPRQLMMLWTAPTLRHRCAKGWLR
jgi:hypothetical protein